MADVSRNDPYENSRLLGYYPFSGYLRERFGCKVHKVSLHGGFTCPTRDGTRGFGGCAYCANESFSPQAGRPIRPIAEVLPLTHSVRLVRAICLNNYHWKLTGDLSYIIIFILVMGFFAIRRLKKRLVN